MEKSMTALISAFSRAYHAENNEEKVFDDCLAKKLLSDEEYNEIGINMANGISFFNPSFCGSPQEALKWIVDNQLSPSPLGRAAFTEAALKTAVITGSNQYIILGAGYDTFAYRQPDWADSLTIFELDLPETAADKASRLAERKIDVPGNVHFIPADLTEDKWKALLTQNIAFSKRKKTFCSLSGLSYYLPKETFQELIISLGEILPAGSSLCFDYPDELSFTEDAGGRAKKQNLLADAAKEKMKASYSYKELEAFFDRTGFAIYEHLTPEEITDTYFRKYNEKNSASPIHALDNVNYCLAVKQS